MIRLSLIALNCLLYVVSSAIIPNDNLENRIAKKPSAEANFEENSESLRKNDDAHLRLYYKSNTPGRSISHELEHRFVKNPFYNQYNPRIPHDSNKYNTQLDINYYDPRNNILSSYPFSNQLPAQNQYFDANKNKQTMLNLHYHGNSLDPIVEQPQQIIPHSQPVQDYQQKNLRANLLRMLLSNMSPTQQVPQQISIQPQQVYMQPPQIDQISNDQIKNDQNGLQYKIVHLKFRIEPQLGRVLGQGIVETDNGAGSAFNARRFSLLPREIPELVRRLLLSAQSQSQASLPRAPGLIKKREDQDALESFEKREEAEESESSKSTDEKEESEHISLKRIKKSINFGETSSFKGDDEDKMNDSEFSESFKSLQRRDDSDDDEEINPLSETDFDNRKPVIPREDEEQELEDSVTTTVENLEY